RLWHGTPILVVISILAYFCFLEQLLVAHNGFAALAISLPFSCILGLFSSLTTTSMVARRYVWIYAAIQFLFVVFFTHLFYRYVSKTEHTLLALLEVSERFVMQVLMSGNCLFVAAASAGCDIHHPGHLCGFRRGDDRKLHHHRGTEVEDYGPGSAAPCSQATTCCAAAAAGPGIRSAFRPALSRR
uniref:Uncharacterized protein n=1 Tax=Aegilops tauschii subsp. strangulata TaxID=200361 RepID=A0A453ABL4_AEGTS